MNTPPIIQSSELLRLHPSQKIVLLDVCNGAAARERYLESHLEGALYVDLNKDLSDIKPDVSMGGRHPLPSLEKFSETLGALGIAPESHVVAYDDKNGSNAAARLWWMLRALGHEKVQVLNGGLQAAIKAGFRTEGGQAFPQIANPYPIEKWQLPMAEMPEVEKVSQRKDYLVIDVREAARYLGQVEPIDAVAGHIPGAVNVPFSTNLDEAGHFLPSDQLRARYQQIFGDKPAENIIVHCGSGVTACHTLLAMAYAGLEMPKLYVGSWSEWSRNGKEVG